MVELLIAIRKSIDEAEEVISKLYNAHDGDKNASLAAIHEYKYTLMAAEHEIAKVEKKTPEHYALSAYMCAVRRSVKTERFLKSHSRPGRDDVIAEINDGFTRVRGMIDYIADMYTNDGGIDLFIQEV